MPTWERDVSCCFSYLKSRAPSVYKGRDIPVSLAQGEDGMRPHCSAQGRPGTGGTHTQGAHVVGTHGGQTQGSSQQEGEAVEDTKPTEVSRIFPTTFKSSRLTSGKK